MCSSQTNAKGIDKEVQSEIQKLTDVHIGVFFDKSELTCSTAYSIADSKIPRYRILDGGDTPTERDSAIRRQIFPSYKIMANPDITAGKLCEIENAADENAIGFSNIGILYSLFDTTEIALISKDGEYEAYIYPRTFKFYVEGCGASELSSKSINGKVSYDILGKDPLDNLWNDLGVGESGVIATVSKAIIRVCECIKNQGITNETKLHFFIFGAGRGAACASLFSNLLTRDRENSAFKLPCEPLFEEFLRDRGYFDKANKCVKFLEDFVIKEKVVIEVLGLFDNVASIGMLANAEGSADIDYYTKSPISDIDSEFVKDVVQNCLGELDSDIIESIVKVVISVLCGSIGEGIGGKIIGTLIGIIGPPLAKAAEKKSLQTKTNNELHPNNAQDYGLYLGDIPDKRIAHIFHICAMDEYRKNYALVNMGSLQKPGKNTVEVLIPGSHDDVCGASTERSNSSFLNNNPKWYIFFNSHCKENGIIKLDDSSRAFEILGWKTYYSVGPDTLREQGNFKTGRHYSKIPMAMMHGYCNSVYKLGPGKNIFSEIPTGYKYDSYEEIIASLGKKICDRIQRIAEQEPNIEGTRYWLYPGAGDDLPSFDNVSGILNLHQHHQMYCSLRSSYLSFSAGDKSPDEPSIDGNTVCRVSYNTDTSQAGTQCYLNDLVGEAIDIVDP